MIVPYHSILKSSITVTIVFHSLYYEDRALVKCSLSKSDGDLNRFLTSWQVYSPHKPHSLIKWATGHRVTLSRTNLWVRQTPSVPEDRSDDWGIQGIPRLRVAPSSFSSTSGSRGIQGIPRLRAAPSSFSSTSTNTSRTSGRFPARIVFRLRGRNDFLLAKCGACIQHDERAVNDRSLIDTGRGTTVNTTIRPRPVSVSFPHLVTFHHSIDS